MGQMRIFFNGRFLCQPKTGVQRYAFEVLKALDELIEAGEIDASPYRLVVLAPPEPCSPLPLRHIEVRQVGRLKGNLWEQLDLAWHARGGLLVDLCNIGPLLHFNQVVTIHDASVYAVPEAYSLPFRLKYQVIFYVLGRTARHIFTDSQFSKSELFRYCGIRPEKIDVVPIGREHILAVEADEGVFAKHDIGSRPYVFAVSSNSPHKNFATLIKALNLLEEVDFDVVIAGGTFSKVFQATNLELPAYVKQIGYVSDSELRALYEHAACFVFPSYYEGFGLPPLEAMTLGCPVVVSNAASMPEVCGDAAVYFEPLLSERLVDCISNIMSSEELRSDLIVKGRTRAKNYCWDETARACWYIIEMREKIRS